MNRTATLLKSDFKNIFRDQLMFFLMILPLLFAVGIRLGIPPLRDFILSKTDFDLTEYYQLITVMFMIMGPAMFGWVVGFLILDEKDERVLSYIAVTPLSRSGYTLYKIAASTTISFVLSVVFLLISGITEVSYLRIIPVLAMNSLSAPLCALFLGVLANNKLEGLAYAKLMGLIFLAPFAVYLVPGQWHLFAGFVPTYWIARTFQASFTGGWNYLLSLVAGFGLHIGFIFFILKRFNRISVN